MRYVKTSMGLHFYSKNWLKFFLKKKRVLEIVLAKILGKNFFFEDTIMPSVGHGGGV